ncbi:amino acid ABC transporter substrate-binding protein, PAAT family [Shimia gijangensis]|uniref:Amino acid ABC transporter substrate-binding protein, PAAT family n=2 Tax=Shimia gijangensis TaxID=1470563 RepID=A0A1M6MLN2_9RHOB|nr:amino acid ABC transporter substrate-binding protein, PAAT family [Shimia gijangensis]
MKNFFLSLLTIGLLAFPAHAQTLDRIKETGQLKLGYRIDAAPLSYQRVGGEPAGYSPLICVQLGQAIANHLKMKDLEAIFVPVDASDRFDKVASGEIDLLCGAATITLSRRELVDFSIPTFVDGTSLIVHNDSPDSFQELAGKKLGVRKDTTTEQALNNSVKAAGMDAKVYTFSSHRLGMAALESNEIDAYFADQSILSGLRMASAKANELKMLSEILTLEKQGLALARGDSEFRLLVDRTISEMYARGEMVRILEGEIPGARPGIALKAMYLIAPTTE